MNVGEMDAVMNWWGQVYPSSQWGVFAPCHQTEIYDYLDKQVTSVNAKVLELMVQVAVMKNELYDIVRENCELRTKFVNMECQRVKCLNNTQNIPSLNDDCDASNNEEKKNAEQCVLYSACGDNFTKLGLPKNRYRNNICQLQVLKNLCIQKTASKRWRFQHSQRCSILLNNWCSTSIHLMKNMPRRTNKEDIRTANHSREKQEITRVSSSADKSPSESDGDQDGRLWE